MPQQQYGEQRIIYQQQQLYEPQQGQQYGLQSGVSVIPPVQPPPRRAATALQQMGKLIMIVRLHRNILGCLDSKEIMLCE